MADLRLLVFSLLLIVGQPTLAQPAAVIWTSWDVHIDNRDPVENRFRVQEDYRLQFSGTFRFGTASILLRNMEQVAKIQVYQDAQLLEAGCDEDSEGTYCVVYGEDEVSIRYNFRVPITDDAGSFRLVYDVYGALRVYPSGDQLWWVAVPEDKFGFSVEQAQVIVTLPDELMPRRCIDPIATYGASARVSVTEGQVMAVATNGVAPDEGLEIRVQFPHSTGARRPQWQADPGQGLLSPTEAVRIALCLIQGSP